jgi:hypothetical protein
VRRRFRSGAKWRVHANRSAYPVEMLHTILGYLRAFEGLNGFGNFSLSLSLEEISSGGNVEERVERFIREPRGDQVDWGRDSYGGTNQFEFELTPLVDWKAELTVRSGWLLHFWLWDSKKDLDQERGVIKGEEIAGELIEMLGQLFEGPQFEAWALRVRVSDHGYWLDIDEYDYVFLAGEALYWMHFGFSD